jgi:hypothetical protein
MMPERLAPMEMKCGPPQGRSEGFLPLLASPLFTATAVVSQNPKAGVRQTGIRWRLFF